MKAGREPPLNGKCKAGNVSSQRGKTDKRLEENQTLRSHLTRNSKANPAHRGHLGSRRRKRKESERRKNRWHYQSYQVSTRFGRKKKKKRRKEKATPAKGREGPSKIPGMRDLEMGPATLILDSGNKGSPHGSHERGPLDPFPTL